MKKSVGLIGIVIAALVLGAATASAAELRIGYVSLDRLSKEAPQWAAARQSLANEFSPREQQLRSAQKDLQALEDKLNRDNAIMSDQQRQKLEQEIVAKQRDLRRQQDEFRDDSNMRLNEERGKLQRVISKAIAHVAKQENFDLIVGDGVLYHSKRIDITEKVVERLKRAYAAEKASGGGKGNH